MAEERISDSAHSHPTSHQFGRLIFPLVTRILTRARGTVSGFEGSSLSGALSRPSKYTFRKKMKRAVSTSNSEGLTVKRKSRDKATAAFITHV